jgi:DNA-binding HxlR family transcriptional regulator
MTVTKRSPGGGVRQHLESIRGNVYAADCPSRALLDHVTTRWGVLVLALLLDRPHRFNQLAEAIGGVSDKMLSQTLKTLTADGIIERIVVDGPPVRVEYRLTPAGVEIATRVADLVEWLEGNIGQLASAPARAHPRR